MSALSTDAVRELILEALAPKLKSARIDDGTNLVGLGLVDSADLLEVIILVEQETGAEFNPENLDIESGVTLGQLISAFVATSGPKSLCLTPSDADGDVDGSDIDGSDRPESRFFAKRIRFSE